jgi:hypothetical protein
MSSSDDRFLDEQIRATAASTVPAVIEQRLRAQLAQFRSRLSASAMTTKTGRRPWAPPFWLGLGATCAAVAILVAAGLLIRPQTSFAEVAAAVLDRPWIHIRTVGPPDGTGEFWISPSKDISAWRHGGAARYEDYRIQVYHSYEPEEKVVYRGPIVQYSETSQYEMLIAAMKILAQEERPLEKPLAYLEFLGPERDRMAVIDERVRKVTESGRTWLEYRLTVNHTGSKQPMRMLFRVDCVTKLPFLCRIEAHHEGQPVAGESRFEYPDTGPADVYDLGVPRTAKLVDRLPAGDLDRIWKILQAGRERMDSYRAVFVTRIDMLDFPWWTAQPCIFYRKGTKFRADYPGDWKVDLGTTNRPAEGEDIGKWWRARTKLFSFYPHYVLRDSTLFTAELKEVTDRDGTKHQDIASFHKNDFRTKPGETYPPEYSMRPEFACRPPMGLGNPDFEPVIEMHPQEGPPGCILLRIRHTSHKGRINEKGIGIPDAYRYWLDPERDYIAMRQDMITRDGTGRETIYESDTVEQAARSPQGVWYITRIRRRFPSRARNNDFRDQVYDFYVDFDVDLPDALFDPPAPRRIR